MPKIQSCDYRKLAALSLIPVFFIVIETLVALDIQTVFEPPYLLLITNTIFVGLIPLYIAYLSFRTYTGHGRPGVLLLGGGMLAMGMGSIIAGIVRSLPDGANLNVTIYNTAFFVGAVFAFGAALANIYHSSWFPDTRRTRTAALAYTGVVVFTLLFTGATMMGLVPRFFTQDVGPSPLRQGVLISAIVLLAVSSVMFYLEHLRKRENFFFWMAISLGLIAIGLLAFAQEMVVGGLVGWFGRTAEYIGALFALVAFLGARKRAVEERVPVQEMIARFFGEAEAGYRALVEASTSAIVVFDLDNRTLVWNPAAERMFGYTSAEAVGMPVSLFGAGPDFMSFIQAAAPTPGKGNAPSLGEDRIVTVARRKDGSTFPVDMTVFAQRVESTWTRTCIIRDITERKKVEEDLKANEAVLHSFFNAPGVMRGIVEVVSESDVRHIADNTATAAFGGLTPDVMKDKLGSELGEPPDVQHLWIGHYTESMKTGKPVTFEYHDPRGAQGWLSATVSYLGTAVSGYPRFAYIAQDITERRKVDADLRRKQAEVQVMFENIPAGLVLFDATPPYTVLIHNRYYQELFAEPFYSRGMAGLNIYEYAPAVDAEGVIAVLDEVVLTRQPKSFVDFPYKSNPPEQTWINWYLAPIIVDDRVVALVSMSLNVTEQHLAEQAILWRKQREEILANAGTRLLSSENPQEIINDLCRDMMEFLECDVFFNYLVDHDQGRLHLNASAGIPKETAREIQWLDYDSSAVCVCAAQDACRIVAENIATTPDPRTELVRSFGIQAYACHPIQVGDRVMGTISFGARSRTRFTDEELAVMKSMTDLISAALHRMQTDDALRETSESLALSEQALRETGEYLKNLITYANAPIIVWDPQMKITRFNRAFEELTGLNESEVLGETLEFLFPETYREESMKLISRAMKGERMESVEIPIVHRDGSVRTVLWNSATLFDQETGQITVTIAQGQDITERKRAEEAMKEYAANLRRSNEDLERFAYVASHDLKEPLRMVTSFSQMLEQRYKGRLDPDADEFISYIVDGGKKMNALINDLLEFSRITSRGKPFVSTDMNAVLDEVLKSLSIMIQENNATVDVGVLPVVSVDGSQMALVFQNLITNAIKFHDAHTPIVSIDAAREGNEWVFSVRDNGIGIDPEYHEKIFEIFKRLQSKDQYPGTGIGLAICKRVIDRHNGRIWVESEIGQGSTFYFSIPVDQSPGSGSSLASG
jgi:PAS domain S-box-containing protein